MSNGVQDFYDRWSNIYDKFSSNRFVQEWRNDSIQSLGFSGGETVVDVGCGTGANIPIFEEQIDENGDIVCVDISEDSLKSVRERVSKSSYDNVHPVRADGKRLPVDKPDVLYASFSVGMFPDSRGVVQNWIDILDEGDKIGLLNVVKSTENDLMNKPIQVFTGLTLAGASLDEKVENSISGNAFESLDNKVRNVHELLREECVIIEEQSFFNGSVYSITAQVQED